MLTCEQRTALIAILAMVVVAYATLLLLALTPSTYVPTPRCDPGRGDVVSVNPRGFSVCTMATRPD